METTERIVEAYVRHVKGWATIPNIRCDGQNEIDLIAIDPVSLERYHIEVSISISQGFKKLTAKPYDAAKAKEHLLKAGQRRTIGFFVEKKFGAPGVVSRLKDFGFKPGQYHRVIATWSWNDQVAVRAAQEGVELWDFREIIGDIANAIEGSRQYFADDTLRTINLFMHARDERRSTSKQLSSSGRSSKQGEPIGMEGDYWVYENWTHKKAIVHRATCPYCNFGRGAQASNSKANGEWHGPFSSAATAHKKAVRTKQKNVRSCGHCGHTT